jgi:hypothetical protein
MFVNNQGVTYSVLLVLLIELILFVTALFTDWQCFKPSKFGAHGQDSCTKLYKAENENFYRTKTDDATFVLVAIAACNTQLHWVLFIANIIGKKTLCCTPMGQCSQYFYVIAAVLSTVLSLASWALYFDDHKDQHDSYEYSTGFYLVVGGMVLSIYPLTYAITAVCASNSKSWENAAIEHKTTRRLTALRYLRVSS